MNTTTAAHVPASSTVDRDPMRAFWTLYALNIVAIAVFIAASLTDLVLLDVLAALTATGYVVYDLRQVRAELRRPVGEPRRSVSVWMNGLGAALAAVAAVLYTLPLFTG